MGRGLSLAGIFGMSEPTFRDFDPEGVDGLARAGGGLTPLTIAPPSRSHAQLQTLHIPVYSGEVTLSPEAPGTVEAPLRPEPPEWIEGSPLLRQAYALAESAHGSQRRASDGRPFLDHVTEVGTLLHEAGFDVELVATGLLHDAVERGTLSEDALRTEMPESIGELVLTLSEDPTIESFSERKAALRAQVATGGGRALTVFAADKLSDIIGLRRGLETFGVAVEERIGTSVSSMAGHYRESVELIESGDPGSAFASELRAELGRLADDIAPAVEPAARP